MNKRKISKKLALSKETLRNLENAEVRKVAGGATVDCTYTNCCSGYATCATCGGQCGSRLC
ncbi:MAG TPA: class I lanthipeptide [Thermoanaerobaculia bacterium]|nr:class I lanthipeptide [Thermoanaerobaculia bacterium]